MRIIFFSILVLLTIPSIKSQNITYSNIDTYVDSISNIRFESFEVLAKRLIKSEWTDKEKARAIFYWIASNIKYDKDGFKTGFWENYSSDYNIANDTYKWKKGVCSGYSYLFKFMCQEIGLKAEVIDGYSRIDPFQTGLPITKSNHSWNMVSIGGKWELIDVTWASSSAVGNKINDYYFCTIPEEFISNHFTEKEELQLIKKPITKEEFDSYPYISSEYFKLNFNKDFPKKGTIISNNGRAQINISPPDSCTVFAEFHNYNGGKQLMPNYTVEKFNKGIIVNVDFVSKGNYLLELGSFIHDSSFYKISKGVIYFNLTYE